MPTVDLHRGTRLFALARVGIGTSLVVAPRFAGRVLFGEDGTRPATQWALRALGGRDAVLGAGLLVALRRGDDPGVWLAACSVADLTDGVAALVGSRQLPGRAVAMLATAGPGGAIAGWRLRGAGSRAEDVGSRSVGAGSRALGAGG